MSSQRQEHGRPGVLCSQEIAGPSVILVEVGANPFSVIEMNQSANAVMTAEGWEMALGGMGNLMRNSTQW